MTCQHEHSHGLAFCRQCGGALAHRRCSKGHVNPADARFCGDCGENLRQASTQTEAHAPSNAPMRFDLRAMLQEAEEDAHGAISSQAVVSQEDIRKLLKKHREAS